MTNKNNLTTKNKKILNDNIIYYVTIKDDYKHEFHDTVIKNGFYGKEVNQTGSNIYFEIYENKALVIIPHTWIKTMYPIQEIKKTNLKEKELTNTFENGCEHCNNFMDILNWYRNLYYKEPQETERGIMSMAINDMFIKAKELGVIDKF